MVSERGFSVLMASVWRWRRKAAGGRRSGLERSRVPGAALPTPDGSQRDCVFLCPSATSARGVEAERALVAAGIFLLCSMAGLVTPGLPLIILTRPVPLNIAGLAL